MKTILVTGSNGLLGQKITSAILSGKQFRLIATSKGANRFPATAGYQYVPMDILDAENVRQVVTEYQPDVIIHTAALTNVDTCQQQQETAWQLNVEAVQTLVEISTDLDIHMVHLSTDFVFDGADGPYDEHGRTNPLSYYGLTKLKAEEVVQASSCRWSIIRTIIVYGIVAEKSRSNIVLWAKEALQKGKPIKVVNDQWRMPTLAEDLAGGCLLVAEKGATGVYHISGDEMMSIAELVYKVADFWTLDKSLISEVSSASLNQSARRPVKTGFILDKAKTMLSYQPHSFDAGLAIVDSQLKEREKN